MRSTSCRPRSTREQRAIDLRIEARLAFASLGNIEQWFGLGREAEARSEKIGDEGRRLASIAIRAAALNFYGTPYEGITAGEQAVALANACVRHDLAQLRGVRARSGLFYRRPLSRRRASVLIGRARALSSAPENVPPGTTGSSLLVLCHMMNAIVYAWLGEFDESEQCSAAGKRSRRKERPALRYDRGGLWPRSCADDAGQSGWRRKSLSIGRPSFRARTKSACSCPS